MREIKFRVWDNVDYMSGPFTLEDIFKRNIVFPFYLPVMQFSGLKDRNGTDIYEKDIVVTPKGVCPVTYDLGCFYTITISRYRLGGWGANIEVIGNIYENPELLP